MAESSAAPLVVCLAAGPSQKPVISKARNLGFIVVGVDQNPEAAATSLCHHILPLSTHEAGPIIEALKSKFPDQTPSAVLNRSSGPPVATCAAICEAFGLPCLPYTRALQCLNKDLLRQECDLKGIATVKHFSSASFSSEIAAEISFPCVVKPALSLVGKQGIRVVSRKEELRSAFDLAKKTSHTGQVVIEDYVPGKDVSIIAVVNHGKVEILALLDEINELKSDGSICGRAMAVPSVFSGTPDEKSLHELVEKIAVIFEVQHSALLVSCRLVAGNNPVLIEIHLDMGGDLILDHLLPAAGNPDILECMINSLVKPTAPISLSPWIPTAVVFGTAAELNTRQPHQILQSSTIAGLSELIIKTTGEMSRP
ncbi:MAG: ATP-grasp domain-containing protein [bacterium]|nr:ATP-grasp domain-containing protein [bacterium]